MTVHHLSFAPRSRFVLVRGRGTARHELNAFDAALLDAGVGNYNLIKVSSILPPKAIRGDRIAFVPGSLLPIAYGAMGTVDHGIRISASVGVGIPKDPTSNGVIMEYHATGTEADADRIVREMTEEAMAMRKIAVQEIASIAIEAVCGDHPTAVFAGVALIPAELYSQTG